MGSRVLSCSEAPVISKSRLCTVRNCELCPRKDPSIMSAFASLAVSRSFIVSLDMSRLYHL